MRIAQVAPLIESVPPRTYGGIERVVSYLTEALVQRGHEVTLFASGDSTTTAEQVAVIEQSLRQSPGHSDPAIWHALQLAELVKIADRFDLVHFHTDVIQYPVWRHVSTPQVTTLHGRLDIPGLEALYTEFQDMAVISISNAQRQPLPKARWVRTVYNGIPTDEYRFQESPGDYLAFLGRISPEKGPEAAIEIAKRANLPLRIAAKVDRVDTEYFEERIRPLLDHPLIDYIGEVGGDEKAALLGGARALLFPIDWPEPFGLVMAESMACGTPVIAFNRGSVPEVLQDGRTGFIVNSIDEAVEAIGKLSEIDRNWCRQHCVENFSVAAMTDGYEAAYRELLASSLSDHARIRQGIRDVAVTEVESIDASVARIPIPPHEGIGVTGTVGHSHIHGYGRPIH